MKKDNQWKRGPGEWLVPPLPTAFIGETGATLQRATFEEQIGSEVFLVLLESGKSSSLLAKQDQLHVRAGIAETRHGPVVFLIWYVVKDGQPAAWSEQFLNPLYKDYFVGPTEREVWSPSGSVDTPGLLQHGFTLSR